MVWPFRNKPDYEREIGALSAKVRKSHIAVLRRQALKSRLNGLFLINTVLVYLVYVGVLLATSRIRQAKHAMIALVAPAVIVAGKKGLDGALGWVIRMQQNHLERLNKKLQAAINAYKKNTNYDKIKQVLEEAEEADKNVKEPKGAQPGAKPHEKARPPTAIGQHVGSKGTNTLPSAPHVGPGPAPAASLGTIATPTLALPGARAPNGSSDSQQASWMDRLMDLVLGENESSPNSRYALICNNCRTHNGLAEYGQAPSDVVYRCPVCAVLNGTPKEPSQGPVSPVLSSPSRCATPSSPASQKTANSITTPPQETIHSAAEKSPTNHSTTSVESNTTAETLHTVNQRAVPYGSTAT